METLVVTAQHQHRNQYYNRNEKTDGPAPFGSFGSPPSRDFRGINCRNFQFGVGLLPTPLMSCTTPVSKCAFSPPFSPKTPSISVTSRSADGKNSEQSKKLVKSSAISIPVNIKVDVCDKEGSLDDELSYSELWAGPTYSNSPPPSSLPMPKFYLWSKRTLSLDLPAAASDINWHPIAKSAPPSPTREHNPSGKYLFHSASSVTKNLRCILNLDITNA